MLSTVNELQLFIIWYIYSIYIYIYIYISTCIIYIYIYIYIYINNILHNTNNTTHYFTPKFLNLYFYANFIRIFLNTLYKITLYMIFAQLHNPNLPQYTI